MHWLLWEAIWLLWGRIRLFRGTIWLPWERIALLWEDGALYTELRGVSLNGTATLIDDPERVADLAQHVVRRNYPETPEDEVPEAARGLARKRTGVVVRPEKIFSWDHRRLT